MKPQFSLLHHMKQNPEQFENETFDLLVIGAGINGAWIALDAAQRGLRVALIDKGDFGAATSAATGRMIHGGIRYLQHLSFGRLRRSLRERMLLLRSAPHLVRPLKFLIPTSGHGMKGKGMLTMAMVLYDCFAAQAVPGPPFASIPAHTRHNREETLRMEPLLSSEGLTGGVCFTDCQMPFPERLTLAVVKTAVAHGARVANYVKAVEVLSEKQIVSGCLVEDVLTGSAWRITAKCIVNAAGPWVGEVTKAARSATLRAKVVASKNEPRKLSKGIHIITRSLTSGHGLALATRHKHSGSWLDRGGRHFFIVPWEGLSLVGTTNVPFTGDPDDPMVTEQDIQGLIEDVNSVYPAAGLCREDVRYFYGGLYPDDPSEGQGYQGGRKDVITDHAQTENIDGLISVTGVKYTTGRHLAKRIVDMATRKLERELVPCRTADTILHGGGIPGFEEFLEQARESLNTLTSDEELRRLVGLYGSEIRAVLREADLDNSGYPLTTEALTEAQARYSVRHEMARKLTDIVFRRSDIGLRGCPTDKILQRIARVMGCELGWDEQRIEREITAVKTSYQTI